jgi:hypothetical protein
MSIDHPPGTQVTVNGRDLWVEREGERPPLVLLPGGPAASHLTFHPHFSVLADRFEIIYVDLHGRAELADRLRTRRSPSTVTSTISKGCAGRLGSRPGTSTASRTAAWSLRPTCRRRPSSTTFPRRAQPMEESHVELRTIEGSGSGRTAGHSLPMPMGSGGTTHECRPKNVWSSSGSLGDGGGWLRPVEGRAGPDKDAAPDGVC